MRGVIAEATLVELPTFADERGSLGVVQSPELPFAVQRAYFFYDVRPEASRGNHGHKRLKQLIIAVAGRFTVTLSDGREERSWTLDSPRRGLYIPPMMWRTLDGFSQGSVCLVLASEPYSESDYFRDKADFLKVAQSSEVPQ